MMNTNRSSLIVSSLLAFAATTHGLSSVLVAPDVPSPSTLRSTNPFKSEGLDLDVDYDELFSRIQHVSPLAKSAIAGTGGNRGLQGIDDQEHGDLRWKKVEKNSRGPVQQIDKIDSFGGESVPLFRFRSSLQGPCVGEYFGKFIVDLDERKKWDDQIEDVYEAYPINDLDSANIAMGFGRYGDCSRLGLGYAKTKKGLITPREQLFLYGLQDFADGSCVLWGTEMDEEYNHLMPSGKRHTRARSKLFSATLTPTSADSFDIEYVLQLDIGGNVPKFLTTPVMIDTVKALFKTAEKEFGAAGDGGALDAYLKEKVVQDSLANRHSLLMTP